jgi:hypothetical protein
MYLERKISREEAFRSPINGGVAKLAYAADFQSAGGFRLAGSSPATPIFSSFGPREVGTSEGLTNRGVSSLGTSKFSIERQTPSRLD